MDNKSKRVPLETIDDLPVPPVDDVPAKPIAGPVVPEELQSKIVEVLRTCYDPEIPVDIYELGLIYSIDVDPAGAVALRMTLTSPGCPAAGSLPGEVQSKAASVAGVQSVKVDVVWDPPWDPSRMSEAARLQLGLEYY